MILPTGRPRLIPAHAGKTVASATSGAGLPAHPRSHGENVTVLPQQSAQPGSSPLMRGKPRHQRVRRAGAGLTPAHAGKTRRCCRACSGRWAHPRSRGENAALVTGTILPSGSSPLMRGKHHGRHGRYLRRGLIPAHAGKTEPGCSRTSPSTAHPHSCGENVVCFCAPSAVQGSSPLTRGKPEHAGRNLRRRGLIPAHAGKTRRPSRCRSTRWAHPHSCRENMVSDGKVSLEDG